MSQAIIIPPEDMRKMQLLQVDMLKELDRVCRANGIHYTISNGSLLGAIRHKGYIPWDDDADTVMLREDYEKFKKCADQLNPSICYFQDHSTDPKYRWGYGKLRRTGTTYIRAGQEHIGERTGVFIDIFPLDDVPSSRIGEEIQNAIGYCVRKITYSEVAKINSKGFRKIWFCVLSKISVDYALKLLSVYTQKSTDTINGKTARCLCMPCPRRYIDEKYGTRRGRLKEWVLDTVDIQFEDIFVQATKEAEKCLIWQYGNDYMTPPPIDQRAQHAPVSSYSLIERT